MSLEEATALRVCPDQLIHMSCSQGQSQQQKISSCQETLSSWCFYLKPTKSTHVFYYQQRFTLQMDPVCCVLGVLSGHMDAASSSGRLVYRRQEKAQHIEFQGVSVGQREQLIFPCCNCGKMLPVVDGHLLLHPHPASSVQGVN